MSEIAEGVAPSEVTSSHPPAAKGPVSAEASASSAPSVDSNPSGPAIEPDGAPETPITPGEASRAPDSSSGPQESPIVQAPEKVVSAEFSRKAVGGMLDDGLRELREAIPKGLLEDNLSNRTLIREALSYRGGQEDSALEGNSLLAIVDGLRATNNPLSVRLADDLELAMRVKMPDGTLIPFKSWDRTSGEGVVGFNFGETKDPAVVRVDTVLDNQISDLERAISDLQELGENAKGLAEKRKLYAKAVAARNAKGEFGPMFKLAVLRDMQAQGLNVSSAIDELSPNESKYQKDFNKFLVESGMDPKEAQRLGKLVAEKGLAEVLANNKIPTPKGLEEKVFGRALSLEEAAQLAKAFMTEEQIKKYGAKDGLILLILLGVLSAVEIAKMTNPLNEQK